MNNNILKDMIFISHAEEDNDFTMWLALQLANKGYGVWCDLTKLLGGEDWPREINYALQTRTQKFLFVLSKYSNQKHNPQGELTSAFNIMRSENLDNLIVPLKIDDLEYSKIDFRLQNIQSINFFDYWAEGLSQLLRMLERDNVKKHSSFTPDAVNYWWNNYKSVANTVSYTPEELFSNRYPIIHYPQFIYTHHVTTKIPKLRQFVPYSFIPFKRYLLTYTEAELLYEYLNLKILDTRKVDIHEFINGKSNIVDNSQEAKRIVARLYNQIFQKGLRSKGLLQYELANKRYCYYFDEKILLDGKIIYSGNNELSPKIKLWGKTLGEKWHWAIRGRFESQPLWHYNIQYHILVGDEETGNIHSAPKRVYNRWNNSTWRNRLRASILHLAEGNNKIIFRVSNDQIVCIDTSSMIFTSPITFIEPKTVLVIEDENE